MSSSLTTLDRVLSDPVRHFSEKHRLVSHLQTAIRLAESHFSPIQDLRVGVEVDPETDEEALVIDVSIQMDVDEVLKRKQAYTRDWVNSAPPGARERICLLFDIV